jgi:hypothetical protein
VPQAICETFHKRERWQWGQDPTGCPAFGFTGTTEAKILRADSRADRSRVRHHELSARQECGGFGDSSVTPQGSRAICENLLATVAVACRCQRQSISFGGMSQHDEQFNRAVDNVGWCRTLHIGERRIDIACLIRTGDWRPLKAPWWRGKEVSVVGADTDGNFFLRHCDGSIGYWDHRLQKDIILAKSVREFAGLITKEQR